MTGSERATITFSKELKQRLEEEAEKQKKSLTEVVNNLCQQALKTKSRNYKGFRLIKHMTYPYTCFECQEEKQTGLPAWFDDETGATLCVKCGVFKYGLESDVNVKQDQKLYALKKLLGDYKIELKKVRQMKHSLDVQIQNEQLLQRLFNQLQDTKDKALRVLGFTDTPHDLKLTAEALLRILDKEEKVLALILDQKEKDKWEELKEKRKKEKRKAKIYA